VGSVRFSEYFGLGRVQAELDFVDVVLDEDTPLFVDPYNLRTRVDDFSASCARSIVVYFQALLDAIRNGDDEEARRLLGALHEPNETRLGFSRGRPQGSAIGSGLAEAILTSLRGSPAVQSGLLSDLSETELFVEGIGSDRISDLTTNVIRGQLLSYTRDQCALHGVPLVNVPAGPIWDVGSLEWAEQFADMPVVNGRKVLLVPKAAVRWEPSLTHGEYYDDFVLHYLRGMELQKSNSGLVRLIKRTGERKILKKDLEAAYPLSKRFLQTFSEQHPDVLDNYRQAKSGTAVLSPTDLDEDFDESLFARQLIVALQNIPPGNADATRYHRLMIGVLEFIFYPNLIYPVKEHEIDDGRKRIDIAYTNYARDGLFSRFSAVTRRPSNLISVECKNYTNDVANPELDQLAGRFADNRGWLGLLTCRHIDDKRLFIRRCNDTARAGRGYILPLDDTDIVTMLEHIERGNRSSVMERLEMRFRELAN
jgi:hypothetical protein